MGFDWPTYLLGLSTGVALEAAVGAFITAPLAVWYLQRKLPSILREKILNDEKLVAELRNKFVNALLGGAGGRPPSIKTMVKTIGYQMAMKKLPDILERLGKHGEAQGVKDALKRKVAEGVTEEAVVAITNTPTP